MARIKPRLLWLAPLILAYLGIRALPASTWHVPADLRLLAVSAALPVGLGIWRGQTIMVWRDADGAWWRQGSMLTLALWGALIAARGLLYGVDAALGHRKAPGLRAILLTLALSFAGTQNSQIWTALALVGLDSTSVQIGGSARVLPDLVHHSASPSIDVVGAA